ncbi:hypothetical protein ACFLYL_02830 [Chloroflexota bacterium]
MSSNVIKADTVITKPDKADIEAEGAKVSIGDARTGTPEVEEDVPSIDIVYTEVKDRLDVQLRQIDTLDSKSGNLLFISSIVIGIGAAAQAALIGRTESASTLLIYSIPIFLYLLVMFFALRGWIVRPTSVTLSQDPFATTISLNKPILPSAGLLPILSRPRMECSDY